MFDALRERGFQIVCVSHAAAILQVDFPEAVRDIEEVLSTVEIPITEIVGSGGGEAKGTQRLRRALAARGWTKGTFEIKKIINGAERESISHEVDHVRTYPGGNVIALEIEWNNKDPFFDRDLENFKRLHAEGAISVGIIITRGTSLQEQLRDFVLRFAQERGVRGFEDLERLGLDQTKRQRSGVQARVGRARNAIPFAEAWASNFVADKFGAATTHWRKLEDRIARGVGNPCPLVLIGLPACLVTFEPDARVSSFEITEEDV